MACPFCEARLKFAPPEDKFTIKNFLDVMIGMGACIPPLSVGLLVISYHEGINLISMLGIQALVGIILIADIISAVIVLYSSYQR